MKIHKFLGVLIILINAYFLLAGSQELYHSFFGGGITRVVGFSIVALVTVIILAIIGIFSGILTLINYKGKSKLFSILGLIIPPISLLIVFLSVR